jgi:AraC-like DNA-binding protein
MADAGRLAGLLANFDSSTPTLTLFRVAAGVRLVGPPVDGVAALVVLSGTMLLAIDDESARTVAAGSLVLVSARRAIKLAPAGTTVTTTVDGRASLVSRDGWLTADAARGREAALVAAAGRIPGSTEVSSGTIVVPIGTDPICRPIFAQLRAECDRGAAGLPQLAAALMNACVIQGIRRAIDAAPDTLPAPSHRGLIARAVAAIRTRPGEPHTVDTLADLAGMSRSTFLRHFRSAFRIPPSAYVQQVRLEEARTLLVSTDLPVKAIASRTGFASRSHFSRLFRAAFGDDPSSYRERERGDA